MVLTQGPCLEGCFEYTGVCMCLMGGGEGEGNGRLCGRGLTDGGDFIRGSRASWLLLCVHIMVAPADYNASGAVCVHMQGSTTCLQRGA
jgi:hypothetical protein